MTLPDWQDLLHCKLHPWQVCARVHTLCCVWMMTFGEYFAGGLDQGLLPIGAICAFCYPGAGC